MFNLFFQLVVLALAAVALAEPEADPLQYYTNGQYIYKAHESPVVANKYVVPAMYYNNPAMYYNTAAMYYSNPAMYYQYNPIVYTAPVAKAEEEVKPAEAEKPAEEAQPEAPVVAVAEPAPVEATKYVIPSVYTIPQTVAYTTPVVAPVAYKAVPSYYASSAPGVVHQVAKREAEPSADASAYYYGAYGYAAPAVYNYGYSFPSVYAGYRAPFYGYRYY